MTDAELERINVERRKRGLPPLTRLQATTAAVHAPDRTDSGFNFTDFLIGYTTGIPMPSTGGIVGSMLHPTPSRDDTPASSYSAPDPSPSPSYDSSPSYSGGSDGGGGGGE